MECSNALIPVIQSGLQSYLDSIREIPMLSEAEEYMLAVRLKTKNDLSAAKKLIASHLRLAAKIAFSYRSYGLPMEDLISEANIGLMQAVKKYEPSKGNRLSTYAIWWIKAQINEFILRSWSLVKIGTVAAQKKLFYNLRKIKAKLGLIENASLDADSVREIASTLKVPEDEVVAMDGRMCGDVSLNTPVSDEDGSAEKIDFIASSGNLEDQLVAREEHRYRMTMLRAAMANLNDREREIILKRRLAEDPETLDDLSERFGISRERVRQIETRAVEKMTAFVAQQQGNHTNVMVG
ncbi:MAG: RNA polymerase sigma factor RpoH [Alphaproteobacteria bacterium]|nr:RNA polymerase sigma factor RpoH [Alphaproteobacteria bacterium]